MGTTAELSVEAMALSTFRRVWSEYTKRQKVRRNLRRAAKKQRGLEKDARKGDLPSS